MPGIGAVSAFTVLALLPEPGHLNRQQVAALAGVAPLNRDSGQMRGRRSCWGGRAVLRQTLYMAALSAMRGQTRLGQIHRNLIARGTPFKVAMVALMRKMLRARAYAGLSEPEKALAAVTPTDAGAAPVTDLAALAAELDTDAERLQKRADNLFDITIIQSPGEKIVTGNLGAKYAAKPITGDEEPLITTGDVECWVDVVFWELARDPEFKGTILPRQAILMPPWYFWVPRMCLTCPPTARPRAHPQKFWAARSGRTCCRMQGIQRSGRNSVSPMQTRLRCQTA